MEKFFRDLRADGAFKVGLFDNLKAVAGKLDEAPHSYKTSLDKFQDIDVAKLTRDLELESRGQKRGEEGDPPAGSDQFDIVENEIVNAVETLKSEAIAVYSGQVEVLTERISGLDFEGSLGKVPLELNSGIQAFKSIIHNGLNYLHEFRREVKTKETELSTFRKEHRRKLSAHFHELPFKILLVSVMVLLFAIESYANAQFLSEGNEQGLVGAYTEAFTISFLNIGVVWILARYAVYVLHVKIWMKLFGLVAIGLFLAEAFFLNLLVAHYRDATSSLLEDGARQAIASFRENLFQLDSFKSWILFGMGSLFSLISFIDGLNWDEKYPGYGRVSRAATAARAAYIAETEHQISELRNEHDDAIEDLKEMKENLARWRREHSALLDHRRNWIQALEEHMNQLERTGRTLLEIYREANRKARNGNAPKRFKDKWSLMRPKVDPALPPEALSKEDLDRLLERTNAELESGVTRINELYDDGLKSYWKLDELVNDDGQLDLTLAPGLKPTEEKEN